MTGCVVGVEDVWFIHFELKSVSAQPLAIETFYHYD